MISVSATSGAVNSLMIYTGADPTTVTASTTGDVLFAVETDGTGPVNIGPSTANNLHVVQSGLSAANLVVTGAVTAINVDVQWGATAGSHVVLGALVKGTQTVSIKTDNDGTISQSTAAVLTISTPVLSLQSNTGAIGSLTK